MVAADAFSSTNADSVASAIWQKTVEPLEMLRNNEFGMPTVGQFDSKVKGRMYQLKSMQLGTLKKAMEERNLEVDDALDRVELMKSM